MWLIVALIAKHQICDIYIQHALFSPQTKKSWFNFVAWWHYTHHAIGTFIVIWSFTNIHAAVLVALLDWFAHWIIDSTKYSIYQLYPDWKSHRQTNAFFLTCDQLLHLGTYVWIVFIIQMF